MKGTGAKKLGVSFENPGKLIFLQNIPGFCRDIVPEKFEKKKVCVQFSSPIICYQEKHSTTQNSIVKNFWDNRYVKSGWGGWEGVRVWRGGSSLVSL